MTVIPRSLDIIYQPGQEGKWVGSCAPFPDVRAEGRSIHQVDLALAPLLSRALSARHGLELSVSVMPGGERPLEGGCFGKTVPIAAASTWCTMPSLPDRIDR